MSPTLLLVCMSLASYRLARLLTIDTFPPIQWVRDRLTYPYTQPQDSEARRITRVPYWLAYLVMCMWCMPVWTAGAVTIATALTIGVDAPLLVWLAVAAIASLISHVEDFLTR
jgi:hypothetical protein